MGTIRNPRERSSSSSDRNSDKRRGEHSNNRKQRNSEDRHTEGRYQLRPEKYDGTTPLEIFLLQFDNCVEYNGWSGKESLAQLKGALKGTAAQVLMGSQGVTMGYHVLREELQKCFGVEGHTAQFRTLLKTRRRQPGESLRTLYQDVCRLLMLAYPGPQNELRDLLAVEAFVDSLDDNELEISVKDKFPQTLAEAFQAALRLEANRPTARKSKNEEKTGRFGGDSRLKTRFRDDVETRRVDGADEDQLKARLPQIEQELRDTTVELRRSREKDADE